MTTLPAELRGREFKDVVRWIADTRHGGSVNQIAVYAGLTSTMVEKWATGKIRTPTLRSLAVFCGAYKLDLLEVANLAAGTRTTRGRRTLAGLLVALLPWGSAWASNPTAGGSVDEAAHYVKSRRRGLHSHWAPLASFA